MEGKFIVFEGINGCGKQFAAQTAAQFMKDKGYCGLDLVEYTKKNLNFPEPEDVMEYDYFLTAEPTHCWVGKAIRSELFFNNSRNYDEITMMNAYALDRHILYKRLIVPLRNSGKMILQERTLTSSLAIQTSGENAVSWQDIFEHPDHKYVLENLPDIIVVINISPTFAQELTDARCADEADNDKYENIIKQTKMAEVYNSEEFRREFESRGVRVIYIENDKDISSLKKKVKNFISEIIS